jgi:hypothetical protein
MGKDCAMIFVLFSCCCSYCRLAAFVYVWAPIVLAGRLLGGLSV